MKLVYTDGGRKAAGFSDYAKGDCVCRSVAIVSGRPYREVFDRLAIDVQQGLPGFCPGTSGAQAGLGAHD